jgi:hypothetical protein
MQRGDAKWLRNAKKGEGEAPAEPCLQFRLGGSLALPEIGDFAVLLTLHENFF